MLGLLVGAPGRGEVHAAPKSNPQHTNIVISEFRTSGPAGATDEFIELFNPTTATIDISGWQIWEANTDSPFTSRVFTAPALTELISGQHYLVANTGWGGVVPAVTPNGTYSYDIPDNGGIDLIDPGVTPDQDVMIDNIGMALASPFREGNPLLPFPGNSNQSYERGPGGVLGNCTDTDNNATDFKLITPTEPQNLASAVTTACTNPAQTISFTSTAPSGALVGGAGYTPAAAATSGLVVTFSIDASASSFCSISAGMVSFNAVGTCMVDANQPGDSYYSPAPQVQQSFAVGMGIQTITFTSTPPATAKVGATYTPTASGGGSGNPVVITVDAGASAVCSISGSTVSFTAVGTCLLDANQAGNTNWQAAPQVQQSFPVVQGDQAITFTTPAPTAAAVLGTYSPTGTGGGSGNPVVFSIDASASAFCSISAGVVLFDSIGTCVVDANQAGNSNWNAAPQVQQSFLIRNNQTITFTTTAPASATVGGATYTPAASASSGLAVVISIDAASSAVCSISAGTVHFNASGTCLVDANQVGSDTFNPAPQVQQSIPVGPVPTATPSAPTHLVISEFRSRGPLGADDEFVEIYNPYAAPVNIGSWTIRTSAGCGTSITVLVTLPAGTILRPGQHYLVAATGSSTASEADRTFTPGIDDNGGVGLFNFVGTVQDMAGMCAGTLYREGNFLPPLLQENELQNQSYERKPVGAASCYDTNDNIKDFAMFQPADPQNSASPIVMCAGVVAFTPTFTPTRSPTRTPTRAPTAVPGNVVLNEFLPHPRTDWNGDGTINTGDEYIEIINMGTTTINVANWKLDNGQGSADSYTLPNLSLLPRQIAVFYHADTGIGLLDVGSSVRLLKSDGRTADIFNYPLVTAADRTWCRLPDGNGEWGFVCSPTPGKPNQAIKSGTPGEGTGESASSICIKKLAPVTVVNAECNSPGGKMWGEGENGETWLKSRLKFGVFVE